MFRTYGEPVYKSALISAECQSAINEYNLNSLYNGITSNVIFSFNNGVPDEQQQNEIEEMIYEKFSSFKNACRPLITFNNDKEHSLEISKVDVEDFVERYGALQKRSADEIYSAFRMSPMLAGITIDNNGFAEQDFSSAYKLFNKTVVSPLQKDIVNSINMILGDNSIEIKPFSINWSEDNKEINENID